jgi:hypothetical protein
MYSLGNPIELLGGSNVTLCFNYQLSRPLDGKNTVVSYVEITLYVVASNAPMMYTT